MNEITLTKVGGIGQLSGWDNQGRYWVQCWTDCIARGFERRHVRVVRKVAYRGFRNLDLLGKWRTQVR